MSRLLITSLILFSVVLTGTTSSIAGELTIKPESCVEDTDFMRRNHMDMLQHDRDKTMHKGIRDIKFSLKGCINCHAEKDESGQVVNIKDERHFCRGCHDYAAVKVDCFQCHSSLPEEKKALPKDKVHQKIKKEVSNNE